MFTQHVWYKYFHTLKLTLGNIFFSFFFPYFFSFCWPATNSDIFNCKPILNKYAVFSKEPCCVDQVLLHSKPWGVGVGEKEEVQEGLGMEVVQEVAAWKEVAEAQERRDSLERCWGEHWHVREASVVGCRGQRFHPISHGWSLCIFPKGEEKLIIKKQVFWLISS